MTSTVPGIDESNEFASFSWYTMTPEQAQEMCRKARGLPGVARSEADGGFYIPARYDDVITVMDDPATFSSTPTVFRPMAGQPPFAALEYDPPHHAEWRDIYRELVNPRTVKSLEPQIRADVDGHIDRFIGKGEADLVADLAHYVPSESICRAAGIQDMAVAERVTSKAMEGIDASGRDPENFPRLIAEFGELIMPMIFERRESPRDDFLTRLANAEVEGKPLTVPETVGALFGLFGAGHHSTTSAMGTLFYHVLSRPEVVAALVEKPRLIVAAVEESLRLDGPFSGFYRRATTDTEIAGTPIAADESIVANWMSANRDPAQFEDPDDFRLDRTRNKHVAFGYGIHTCVGAPLARLELKIALERVLTRMPDIELVDRPTRFFGGAGATYLDAVRVRFTPNS